MKRVVSILCVVALMLAMLALSGCGLSGTYQMVEMSYSGMSLDSTALATAGISATLVVDGDQATLTLASTSGESESTALVVDTKNKTFTATTDGTAIPYVLDGKRLTFEKDGTKMIFEKQ